MDLSKLTVRTGRRERPVPPDAIFGSLTLRGTVENVWGPQTDALRLWHENREKSDVTVEMSTGGGKTLVGLLIAQSIINETGGKVLYVCPTNQLVEQTASQARECGLEVSTYMRSMWSGDAYDSCSGPCVTNYAAVFNGRTIFREHDLKGIIFDDAHVAHNVVRSQYTLRLHDDHQAFRDVANLFREHFARNSQTQHLNDALAGDWQTLLFVPMFEVARNSNIMTKLLLQAGVSDENETKFAWEHLKDRLSRCVVLISGGCLEIAPPVLPIHTLPYFDQGTRRIYLTATMPSQVELMRTFGVAEAEHIAPAGKSGEAQRLFIFIQGDTNEEQRQSAQELIESHKACIIVPSRRKADQWEIGQRYDGDRGHAGIQAFSGAEPPEKLILIARYDGIDLPGKACQALVLDDLPAGEFLLDRFTDQGLKVERLRQAHTAVRIVQAIGRIFRSNTDHGAVLLCGDNLQRWLYDPNHRQYMPDLLQKQVQLGIELRRLVNEGGVEFPELLDGVLEGRSAWDKFYAEHIDGFEALPTPKGVEWFTQLVVEERSAYAELWDGEISAAAEMYQKLAGEAGLREPRLSAWYWHWHGLALDLAGDQDGALAAYVKAANERAELGRPRVRIDRIVPAEDVTVSTQARIIAVHIQRSKAKLVAEIRRIRQSLSYSDDTNPVEEALCRLGLLLGLEARRPDHEEGTGPDVLWSVETSPVLLALEAKTNKHSGSQYRKSDIGQFHDHLQWLRDNYEAGHFLKAIVGRLLPVSSAANPPADLQIVSLEQFVNLLDRFQELAEFVESDNSDEDVETRVERGLRLLGLKWPGCAESLEGRWALDLQGEQQAVAEKGD